jgi:hypothetical protein
MTHSLDDSRNSYVWEKLHQAVDALVTGRSPLRERLANTAVYLIRLRRDDLPEGEMRRAFVGIQDDLTWVEASGDEGRIASSTRQLDDEEAKALAGRILKLFLAVNDLRRPLT